MKKRLVVVSRIKGLKEGFPHQYFKRSYNGKNQSHPSVKNRNKKNEKKTIFSILHLDTSLLLVLVHFAHIWLTDSLETSDDMEFVKIRNNEKYVLIINTDSHLIDYRIFYLLLHLLFKMIELKILQNFIKKRFVAEDIAREKFPLIPS